MNGVVVAHAPASSSAKPGAVTWRSGIDVEAM